MSDKNAYTDSGSSPPLMTVEDVAAYLNISRSQAYLTVRSHDFPLIELGPRLLRVDRGQLQKWLGSRKN
jgi:excisionase family DNA binding protein